jgi:hypothetical protein
MTYCIGTALKLACEYFEALMQTFHEKLCNRRSGSSRKLTTLLCIVSPNLSIIYSSDRNGEVSMCNTVFLSIKLRTAPRDTRRPIKICLLVFYFAISFQFAGKFF